MDIGCNKGNNAIKLMERWDLSANHFWSTAKWMHFLANNLHTGGYACPASPDVDTTATCAVGWGCTCQGFSDCFGTDHLKGLWGTASPDAQVWWHKRKCTTSPTGASCPAAVNASTHALAHSSDKPTGICVEPMRANVKLLNQASAGLGYGAQTAHGSFHVVQAAIMNKADTNQTVEFPDGDPGLETAGLPAFFPVPVKTVDMLKADFALSRIDILTIDTEGADPYVLQGSLKTLPTVRYLQFEVHRDLKQTAWGKITLRSIVTMLDQQGFDCYWAGNNGNLLSMNNCWSPKFEIGTWANAACAKRGDIWSEVLKRFQT